MEEHLEEQLQALDIQTFVDKESGAIVRSMLYTNTLSAQAKLLKYKKLNVSPVLFAACILVPWRKWSYFEDNMTLEDYYYYYSSF